MEYIKLNDGNTIPPIGFGTYKATEQEGIESVKQALENGYRLLDGAARYENEEAVGKGIKESGVSREDVFITTKVWREHLGYEETKKAFYTSLKQLGLDYIDLYLIHWPANYKNFGDNWKKVNADTWRALEDLQEEGKIKSIGVSNFLVEHLEALLETAKVIPAINQIEFHPGYWQQEVKEYCDNKNIIIEAWSPLARGRVFNNELLQKIAEKHKKSIPQICLKWCLQHHVIPIPKSTTVDRIIDNIDIFDFELSEKEMLEINEIPQIGFSGELPNEWPDRLPAS
ncbi:aldo/keto reductase [Chishuiella sp.]|uniref:aldo/keto reductase n=1 Tax=Chishuiella sp. TaxID=1969467 RepID=UPI0028AC9480|nr:aldo/keto reductase [Chishuiella sp.]